MSSGPVECRCANTLRGFSNCRAAYRSPSVPQSRSMAATAPSMPCSAEVRTTSPPSRRIISTRSPLTVLGMYARNGTPTVAQTMLSAIEVDPLDASTTTVVGETSPEAIACATMSVAIRSLVQPLGSRWSSFSHRVQPRRLVLVTGWSGSRAGAAAARTHAR